MLKTKEIFEVNKRKVYSSIDQADGEVATVKDIIDTGEPKNKLKYQMIEILIYFGWPLLVVWGINKIIPVHIIIFVFIFFLLFFWPVIKGKIGLLIAKKKKIKDPRHAIKSSSFWYDGFLFVGSNVLKAVRKYSALSRSLDIIYNFSARFGIEPRDFDKDWWRRISKIYLINFLIKQWTNFWSKMPIACDVRTRLVLVSEETKRIIRDIYYKDPHKEIRIVLLAGGTKQDLIMAVSDLKQDLPDLKIKVVCVEPDGLFAVKRSRELMEHFQVDKDIFIDIYERVYVESTSHKTLKHVLKDKGYSFKDFDLVVCIGLGDYMYGEKIHDFLKMLDNGSRIITANISDNFIERFFLHKLLQWPKMQYLGLKKYKGFLIRTFGVNRKITIFRTPNKIFNVAIIE